MDTNIKRRKPWLRPLRDGEVRFICWCDNGAGYGVTAKEAYDNWQAATRV